MGDMSLCSWLFPLHPPTGSPHPWVLEKGLLVPAGAGQWGPSPFPALGDVGCSQASSSSIGGGGGFPSESHLPEGSPRPPRGRGAGTSAGSTPCPPRSALGMLGGRVGPPRGWRSDAEANPSTSRHIPTCLCCRNPWGTCPCCLPQPSPQAALAGAEAVLPARLAKAVPLPTKVSSFLFCSPFIFFYLVLKTKAQCSCGAEQPKSLW